MKKNNKKKIWFPLYPDLIANILSRLPAESLLQCKLVSKQWCLLIDNETPSPVAFVFLHRGRPSAMNFIAAYMSRKGKLARRFIALHHGHSLITFMQYPNSDHPSDLIASCNGLFLHCCRTAKPWYQVCNPATKKWVFLPDPPCPQLICTDDPRTRN